jgi:uncharacterized membrane protein
VTLDRSARAGAAPLTRGILLSLLGLLVALVLSVAIGPVYIAPQTVVSVLAARLAGAVLQTDSANLFATILLEIRLPHAVLLLLTHI